MESFSKIIYRNVSAMLQWPSLVSVLVIGVKMNDLGGKRLQACLGEHVQSDPIWRKLIRVTDCPNEQKNYVWWKAIMVASLLDPSIYFILFVSFCFLRFVASNSFGLSFARRQNLAFPIACSLYHPSTFVVVIKVAITTLIPMFRVQVALSFLQHCFRWCYSENN